MAKLFLNEKQIATLLQWAWSTSPRDFALFHVALATGLRAGDLLKLLRTDVENEDGTIVRSIKIRMQKTGSTVERGMSDNCRGSIRKYLAERNDENPFLFASESNNRKAGPMNRSSLHRLFKKYLGHMIDDEDLRGNACHVTRRSVAQLIAAKAGRIEPATRFLGHTSVANTIHYLDMDGYGRQADEIVNALSWNKGT